jgi:hypothetical protein
MSADATPQTASDVKEDKPFPVSPYWVALFAFLYIGWLNFVYFFPHPGQDTSASISDFVAEWLGSFTAAILIPAVIAYAARGRKHYRNGFNRWFFWGTVFMLMIQKTMISENFVHQRAAQTQSSRGIK